MYYLQHQRGNSRLEELGGNVETSFIELPEIQAFNIVKNLQRNVLKS